MVRYRALWVKGIIGSLLYSRQVQFVVPGAFDASIRRRVCLCLFAVAVKGDVLCRSGQVVAAFIDYKVSLVTYLSLAMIPHWQRCLMVVVSLILGCESVFGIRRKSLKYTAFPAMCLRPHYILDLRRIAG